VTAQTAMQKTVPKAKSEALRLLAEVGIEDDIVVKIHKTTASALGQYRGASQFRSGTTFWISPDVPAVLVREGIAASMLEDVIVDTILHEYGHVLWEFLRIRSHLNPKAERLWEDVRALSTGSEDDDEEGFAENFGLAVSGREQSPVHLAFARRFGELLKEDR